jgi:hypothetical protein
MENATLAEASPHPSRPFERSSHGLAQLKSLHWSDLFLRAVRKPLKGEWTDRVCGTNRAHTVSTEPASSCQVQNTASSQVMASGLPRMVLVWVTRRCLPLSRRIW